MKRQAFDNTHYELMQIVSKSQMFSALLSAYTTWTMFVTYGLSFDALFAGLLFVIHFLNYPNIWAYDIRTAFYSRNYTPQEFLESMWLLSNFFRLVLHFIEVKILFWSMFFPNYYVLFSFIFNFVVLFQKLKDIYIQWMLLKYPFLTMP